MTEQTPTPTGPQDPQEPATDQPVARPRARTRKPKSDATGGTSTPVPGGTASTPDTSQADATPRDGDSPSGSSGAGVEVTSIRLERGGIGEATAASVDVHMGGIGRLEAEEVLVTMGGIGAARADEIGVRMGSIGAALAGEVNVTQGVAGSIVARQATVSQSLVRTLIARDVTLSRPSWVLVLIAGRVTGDARPLVDWRGALAAGAAMGIAGALLGRRRSRR
jgi:hypothetical protein